MWRPLRSSVSWAVVQTVWSSSAVGPPPGPVSIRSTGQLTGQPRPSRWFDSRGCPPRSPSVAGRAPDCPVVGAPGQRLDPAGDPTGLFAANVVWGNSPRSRLPASGAGALASRFHGRATTATIRTGSHGLCPADRNRVGVIAQPEALYEGAAERFVAGAAQQPAGRRGPVGPPALRTGSGVAPARHHGGCMGHRRLSLDSPVCFRLAALSATRENWPRGFT
jgi:hypothetical protein